MKEENWPFSPECLTVSLGQACNLNCTYCYTKKDSKKDTPPLDETDFLQCVNRAAEYVASHCLAKGIPFFLGFQGGGEPLMYFDRVQKIFSMVTRITLEYNLPLFSFITSNGVFEAEKYKWLADRFNRICLSVDGTGTVHDKLRKDKENHGTFDRVLDTIQTLEKSNKAPVIRITATRYNTAHLVPTVEFLVNKCKITEIQIEPVYAGGISGNLSPSPREFVGNYLQARYLAGKSGCCIQYSGYRKHQRHGPYCNLLKKVLFITPDGNASNCLFRERMDRNHPFVIGSYGKQEKNFILDSQKIVSLAQQISRLYKACLDCPIRCSCVRGCPDVCLIEKDPNYPITESLRCRINTLLYKMEQEKMHGAYS